MTQKTTPRPAYHLYLIVLASYALIYSKYLIKPLGIGPWNATVASIFLAATHILAPLLALIMIITYDNKYNLKNLLNIFLSSWLLFIPLTQLVIIGFAALGHQKENWGFFISILPNSILLAFFGGLLGLLLNSIYILIRRLIHKA